MVETILHGTLIGKIWMPAITCHKQVTVNLTRERARYSGGPAGTFRHVMCSITSDGGIHDAFRALVAAGAQDLNDATSTAAAERFTGNAALGTACGAPVAPAPAESTAAGSRCTGATRSTTRPPSHGPAGPIRAACWSPRLMAG